GLPRNAAQGGRVRIGSEMYPIIASVSASHSIVEIGDERKVDIGDVATIFDAQPGSRPEDLAESCKASVYDLTMHLHADLPRRNAEHAEHAEHAETAETVESFPT